MNRLLIQEVLNPAALSWQPVVGGVPIEGITRDSPDIPAQDLSPPSGQQWSIDRLALSEVAINGDPTITEESLFAIAKVNGVIVCEFALARQNGANTGGTWTGGFSFSAPQVMLNQDVLSVRFWYQVVAPGAFTATITAANIQISLVGRQAPIATNSNSTEKRLAAVGAYVVD